MRLTRFAPPVARTLLAPLALVSTFACAKAEDNSLFIDDSDGGLVTSRPATDAGGDATMVSVRTPPPGDGSSTLVIGDSSPPPPMLAECTEAGLCAHACADGGPGTTVSGTVYDPAGNNPLYGVAVFIPFQPPAPMIAGPVCDCNAIYTGGAVASAITDPQGHFALHNVPDGANVPLVVQIGKWRRQYTISVQACQDNLQPDKSLRLPNNGAVGDLPNIAIATGGADTLECLLRRIGVDASEYVGGPGTTGHIHIYQGDNGPTTAPAAPLAYTDLWSSTAQLMPYDIALLSCEGHETTSDGRRAPLTPAMIQSLSDYASAGGRVFASHFHYAWFNNPAGPFARENLATWTPGANTMTPDPLLATIATTLPNGSAFPKGVAMQQWLSNVGALTNGELPIATPRHNADVSAANTPSTPWISADQNAKPAGATMYLSFDLPIGGASQDSGFEGECGRIVYSDLHVGADSNDYGLMGNPGGFVGGMGNAPITPGGCNATAPLSAQEKALEFMLFDLSACLTPVSQQPVPPPIMPPQ